MWTVIAAVRPPQRVATGEYPVRNTVRLWTLEPGQRELRGKGPCFSVQSLSLPSSRELQLNGLADVKYNIDIL
jgi:hypothetical protein